MRRVKKIIRKIVPEKLILVFWHFPQSFLAALINGFPARKLTVIGVAGTKGKTTTAYLLSQVLEGTGKKVAMISTAFVKIGEEEELNNIKMTTPSPFFLQGFIKKAVEVGCKYLVLETSSHALVQHRTLGIPFKTVVLTNMMPDHLEYHQTKEEYSDSHLKMIKPQLKYLVINGDDPNLSGFLKTQSYLAKKITFGVGDEKTISVTDIILNFKGSIFNIKTEKFSDKINLSLLGKFNIYNALATIAVGLSENIELDIIKKILVDVGGVPGRVERIDCGQEYEVIVDYAHSPDSLVSLFDGVSCFKKNKIITVYGACGDRDPRTRPLMGQVIEKNSDYIIITNDDPYTEDPNKIADDLLSGIKIKKEGESLWKIFDRKLAIEKAISIAERDDLVLILGKGAEQWQIFKDKKIPWDDREIVREAIKKKSKN